MSRHLVAGAAGFLGSHLVDRLLADGHEVIGLDSLVTGNLRNLAHLDAEPRFTFVEVDVAKDVPVAETVDRVWHLASPASPIDYVQLPFVTLYAGSDATRLLLDKARADGARFFLASTSEVYGDPLVHPQVESYWGNVNPIGPRSVYDEAKRYAEALTMAYHRYHDVETRIVRIFNTFGPRMRVNDGRVVPAFCSQAIRGEDLTVFGDGSQTRSYCYVSDLIAGFVALMESDLDQPCNIGNPHELSVLELARTIRDQVGSESQVVHKPLPKDDPKVRRPDITRARENLGWEPQVAFSDGMRRTIAFFRETLE